MNFKNIIEHLNLDVNEKQIAKVLFDMNRYFDKEFTEEISKYQNKNEIKFNTYQRGLIRKYYYYGENKYINQLPIKQFSQIRYDQEDIVAVLEDFNHRIKTYDKNKIFGSLNKRIKEAFYSNGLVDNSAKWLEFYYNKNQKYDFGAIIIKVNQQLFDEIEQNENSLFEYIKIMYDKLQNYRYMDIIFEGSIYKGTIDYTWNLIYKTAIYCENFKVYKEKYFPFNQKKQVYTLQQFLNERFNDINLNIADDFYSGISYGLKYEDCLVSDNQDIKILIMKKIELDNSNIPCPSCLSIEQRGNSYPSLFLRSWECSNPDCPDRSKSGRGKRFDEHGVFRQFKLIEDDEDNRIDANMYKNWQRDIFKSGTNWFEMLIIYNSWVDDNIAVLNIDIETNYRGRYFVKTKIEKTNKNNMFNKLPIVKLFKKISENIVSQEGDKLLQNKIEIVNQKSEEYLRMIKSGQIGSAITSPPYYNAREYSQWPNLILYLIDMMINAKSVYDSLKKNGYYLYNIGDIVSAENIYVNSNMSNRRLMLGFYSALIFEKVGFNLIGNIIWDKGAVQSKRNSTVNLNSGYVKYVNCYEHILVFKKGISSETIKKVFVNPPVIKINNKGENLAKHTAPYPLELVELVREYSSKNYYILDPYLGSGTTLEWCVKNDYLGIGIEINEEYYRLSRENVDKAIDEVSKFRKSI